jgi:hypothetical protein
MAIEGINGSFMPQTLGRTWVGTQGIGGRAGNITGLDLVEKKIYLSF